MSLDLCRRLFLNGWTDEQQSRATNVLPCKTSALASGMVQRWPMVTLLTPLHQLNKPAKLCSLATIQFGLIAHSIRVHHSVHSWTSLGQTAGGMSWCNSPQVEHRSPPLPLGCPRSVMCFARRVSGWRSHPLGEEVYKAIWKFAAILPSWSDGGRINGKWMQMAFINSYGCRFPLSTANTNSKNL